MTTPPLSSVWYDPAAVRDRVFDVLRLMVGDIDTERLESLIPAGAALIDQYIDRVDPLPDPAPAPLIEALVQVVVELYRRKDAPIGTSSTTTAVVPYPLGAVDPLAPLYGMLAPWRQRWGIA